jgi:hypothetical protein
MPGMPGRPEDRIRQMKQMILEMGQASPESIPQAPIPEQPPVQQLEPDFPDMGQPAPAMEMPSAEQINAPVYYGDDMHTGSGEAFGPMFQPGEWQPKPSLTPPPAPPKSARTAAALQQHRANIRARPGG